MPKIRAAARLLDANEKSKCSTSPIGDTLRIAATITARRGLAERCAPLTPPKVRSFDGDRARRLEWVSRVPRA